MKPRLVLAALMPRDVVTRARNDFDALVVEGKDDMTAAQVIEAATAHRADAIMFTNTLPLTADAIARLPPSVRVGATSSVGYDHIDVAAAKARGIVRDQYAGRADRVHRRLRVHDAAGGGSARLRVRQDHACRLALPHRPGRPAWCARVRQDPRHSGNGAHRAGDGTARTGLRHDRAVSFAQPAAAGCWSRARGISHRSTQMLPHCDFLSLHAPAGRRDGQDRQCRGAGADCRAAGCW